MNQLLMRASLISALVALTPAIAGATIADAAFVRMAAMSDMFETKSSELAAIKGDAETRAFAAHMNEAHQKTASELGMIVKGRADDLPLPPRLDPDRQRLVDHLSELDSEAFKRDYLRAQVRAHERAVQVFSNFVSFGNAGPLREWATKTLPELQAHLSETRALLNDRPGAPSSRAPKAPR